MKGYLDLIQIYARTHKRQNRMTLLCISLAVFLVTVIFGMADMEIRGQRLQVFRDKGNWHFGVQADDEQGALIAARPEVKEAGFFETVSGEKGYCINNRAVTVAGMDEKLFMSIFNLEIEEGRYPAGAGEAALTYNAKTSLNIKVGENITVDTPQKEKISCKITGFVENTSSLLQGDSFAVLLDTDTFRALVPKTGHQRNYLVQLSPYCDMYKVINEVREQFHFTEQHTVIHEKLIGLYGQGQSSILTNMYLTALVLFVVVLAAGVLMIASSLNSNVSERTEFFGMMRCLGATRTQIIRFVRREALRWCRFAIPVGIVCGCVVVCVLCAVLRYLSPTYFSELPVVAVSVPSIVFGALTGILSVLFSARSPARRAAAVSPLTAVSGNAGYAEPVKKAADTGFWKMEAALGIHHAKARKKNFLLVSGSFAFSVILFLAFSTAVEFMHHAITPLKPYTPDISLMSEDNTCSLDVNLAEAFADNPSVKRVYGRMFAYDVPVLYKGKGRKINLLSYEKHQFGWAEDFVLEGSLKELREEKDKVMVVYAPDSALRTGDRLTFDWNGESREAEISGILSTAPFSPESGEDTVICSEETFQSLTGKNAYTIIDIQMRRGAADEDVQAIRELAGPGVRFSDRRKGNEEVRGAYWSFALFIYGFLVVIALITVISIMNCIAMSVSAHVRQYGAMRAIGMSTRQLVRMLMAEALTYACAGCIVGCLVGVPANKLLFANLVTSHWGTPWTVPYGRIFTIVLLVVASSAAAVYGPAKRIHEMSIVDTINAQ